MAGQLEELSSDIGTFFNSEYEVTGEESDSVWLIDVFEAHRQYQDMAGVKFTDDLATFGRNLKAATPEVEQKRRHLSQSDQPNSYAGKQFRQSRKLIGVRKRPETTSAEECAQQDLPDFVR